MKLQREIHPDFLHHLKLKDQKLIDTYIDLRNMILEIYPEAMELLYKTHALTSVYTVSDKLTDGYCHIPIYSKHLNLGFNKGTLLQDPHELLQGTGKLIRHIPIVNKEDYRCSKVMDLLTQSIELVIEDCDRELNTEVVSVSKIKK